jgi:hypothetical protein
MQKTQERFSAYLLHPCSRAYPTMQSACRYLLAGGGLAETASDAKKGRAELLIPNSGKDMFGSCSFLPP